jgi:GTPase SAR1 family protein
MDAKPSSLRSTEAYKIAVLAEMGTGKTSLIIRFLENEFYPAYDPTLQDVYHKLVTLHPSKSPKNILLEFFDYVPTEECRVDGFYESYVTNSDGVIIVQDMTGSLKRLTRWIEVVERLKRRVEGEEWSLNGSGFPVVTIGTKGDVPVEGRRNGREKVRGVVEQLGLGFWECSAKEGWGVEEGVMGLVAMMRSVREQKKESERKEAEMR